MSNPKDRIVDIQTRLALRLPDTSEAKSGLLYLARRDSEYLLAEVKRLRELLRHIGVSYCLAMCPVSGERHKPICREINEMINEELEGSPR